MRGALKAAVVAGVLVAAAVARSGAQAPAAAPEVPPAIAAPKPFVPAGFTPLFNGESLAGWHVSRTNHHGITPDYHVLHGMIVAMQQPLGQGGILLTDKTYRNVEIYMEVKPDYGCDSGLFLRSNEAGDAYQVTMDYLPGGSIGGIYGEGLEGVNGQDNSAAGRASRAAAQRGRGAAPPPAAAGEAAPVVGGIPLGGTTGVGDAPWMKAWKREDWNRIRVRMAGAAPHITVWVNDQQVTDFTDRGNHAAGGITEGPIAIQVHGGNRWVPGGFWRWRTIAVKELPADAQ